MKLIDGNTVKRATSWLLAREVALMAYFEALIPQPPVRYISISFLILCASHSNALSAPRRAGDLSPRRLKIARPFYLRSR